MALVSCARAWNLQVERGPDWLFVRPEWTDELGTETASLAEHVWALLDQNFTYRLVLELKNIEQVDSLLIEQLLWLHQQIRRHEGMMRICGLSPANLQLLADEGLDSQFANFRDREEAVMGRQNAAR